jgi:hypothetical protein
VADSQRPQPGRDRAQLTGVDGEPLRVVPHQLRHSYATTLVNTGMSLQALVALLGHITAEMTLRDAILASPTLRAAYDEVIGKPRSQLPIIVNDRPVPPSKVDWLWGEMLKTRVAHGYSIRHLAADVCPGVVRVAACNLPQAGRSRTAVRRAGRSDSRHWCQHRLLHQDAHRVARVGGPCRALRAVAATGRVLPPNCRDAAMSGDSA